MRMYWDTETTGLWYTRDFHNHESHPAIMEYAHVIVDDDWNEVEHYQAYVQIPDHVQVHPKAFAAHGIDREKCANGVRLFDMFHEHVKAIEKCRIVAGYNISFDQGMIEISYHRLNAEFNGQIMTPEFPQMLDLMRYCTPVCALPPTDKMRAAGRGGQFKSPSLTEALKIICKHDHDGAHGALPDARGCVMLHRKLVELRNG